jgi:hypothetical protein
MNATSRTARQLLYDESCSAFQVLFGDRSELAAFKARRTLSVGICLRGTDLRNEKDIIHLFEMQGCLIVDRSAKMDVGGRTMRAFLLQFGTKRSLLAAISALQRWNGDRSRFVVRPALLSIAFKAVPL